MHCSVLIRERNLPKKHTTQIQKWRHEQHTNGTSSAPTADTVQCKPGFFFPHYINVQRSTFNSFITGTFLIASSIWTLPPKASGNYVPGSVSWSWVEEMLEKQPYLRRWLRVRSGHSRKFVTRTEIWWYVCSSHACKISSPSGNHRTIRHSSRQGWRYVVRTFIKSISLIEF